MLPTFCAGLVWRGVWGECEWQVCTLRGQSNRPGTRTGRALAGGVCSADAGLADMCTRSAILALCRKTRRGIRNSPGTRGARWRVTPAGFALIMVSGRQVHTLTGHSSPALSVDFSPNGKHIVTGSSDKRIKIWDTEAGVEVSSFVGWRGFGIASSVMT